ncbi:SDR family oxidoreductase [Pseudomonas gingeri]|uniref:SDR family NAD(P)-dependent oxidoreductase n=1 Tax=Pseudomonas gingeri TaxID=117681 RepID=UPI0015A1B5D9|nr:SDR family oxidoreductase [Pseudomonas gingeri]NWA24359.1 SDR family oxidoreductase [Pseudomonas gingeri]
MSKLIGKTVVITGGSSGIGLATAQRFVQEGAYVYIVGRRQTQLDIAKDLIGKNVTTIQGDVSNLDDLDRMVETIKADRGVVDSIVFSAAVVEQVPLEKITPEHFDKTFNLNARGALFTVQKLLPMMPRGGSIVLVSSGMHSMGLANHSTYAATKAALRSFVRTWAAELNPRGIRANTLSPGVIDTPMLDSQGTPEEAAMLRRAYASATPMGRLGRAEEMASAALFLASDESSFMTGADLVADGGISQL